MPPDPDLQSRSLAARRRSYKTISFGTTLICIGSVLLLNTLGQVGWGVWFDLLRLWPLLLISIGIRSIFVPTRLHLLSLIGPLLVVAGTVLTVAWARDRGGWGPDALERGRAVGIDCPGPVRGVPARLHLTASAARVQVDALPAPSPEQGSAPPAAGLAGTLRYAGDEPEWACSNEGDMWLGSEASGSGFRVMFPFGPRRELWDARLSCANPVLVRGALVAATGRLDLRGFDLDGVDLDLAAASARLTLGPPRRSVEVRLEGAASNVEIRVPEGTCFTLSRERVFSVLRGNALPSRGRRDRRLSADACGGSGAQGPRYEFHLDLPFSTVQVETDRGA